MYRDNHWGTHRRGVHRDSVHRDGTIWICHQVQLTCAHTHTPITTAGLVRLSISTHPLVVIHQASIFTTECADGVHFPANRGDRPPPPPSLPGLLPLYVCLLHLVAGPTGKLREQHLHPQRSAGLGCLQQYTGQDENGAITSATYIIHLSDTAKPWRVCVCVLSFVFCVWLL